MGLSSVMVGRGSNTSKDPAPSSSEETAAPLAEDRCRLRLHSLEAWHRPPGNVGILLGSCVLPTRAQTPTQASEMSLLLVIGHLVRVP